MHPNKSRTLGLWVPHESGKWVDPRHAHWRDPSDVSMVVHDAFHHHPRDKGTNEQEWVTLGMELWLKGLDEHSPLFDHQLGNIIEYLLGSIIEVSETDVNAESRFSDRLHAAPKTAALPNQSWYTIIAEATREVLAYNGYEVADIDQYTKNAAEWAWHGYERAKIVYPDPYKIKQQTRSLEQVIHLCRALATRGLLKQWTARWDLEKGVRAAWQDEQGRWQAVTPEVAAQAG